VSELLGIDVRGDEIRAVFPLDVPRISLEPLYEVVLAQLPWLPWSIFLSFLRSGLHLSFLALARTGRLVLSPGSRSSVGSIRAGSCSASAAGTSSGGVKTFFLGRPFGHTILRSYLSA